MTTLTLLTCAALALAPQDDASAEPWLPWGRTKVVLKSAGEEPRVVLRRRPLDAPLALEYRFDQRLRLTMSDEVSPISQTVDYPLMGLRMSVDAQEDGDALRCSVDVGDAVHADEPNLSAPVLRDVGDQLAAVRGASLSWTARPTGEVVDARARLAGNLSNPDLAFVLFDELSLDWNVALPEEAVGVGAAWTCRGELPVRMVGPDFRADTTLTLEVTEIDDEAVRLRAGLNRVPVPGEAGGPALAENYLCEGSGELEIDRASGLVTWSRMTREVDARVPIGDTGRTWDLHLEVVSVVAGPERIAAADAAADEE